MRTRIIYSLVICFLVLGITSFGLSQTKGKSAKVDRSSYIVNNGDSKIVPYTSGYTKSNLVLAPAFKSGNFVIGPEINTGVTGWDDYMTNGDCRHYIWLDPTNPNIINVIYTITDSTDPVGSTSRRTVYSFSTDGGVTWAPQFNVPNIRSGFGCLTLTSDGRAAIANHQTQSGATISSLYVDSYPQLEGFGEYFAPSTNGVIWPQINMLTNENGILVGNENVSSGNDHVRWSIWAQPSGPIGAWNTLWSETSGTPSNARWGSCTGINGYVAVLIDPVSETNVMGTNAIYSFVSTDNGATFGAQQTEWQPFQEGQDTVTAFFGLDLRCKPGTADRYFVFNTNNGGKYKSARLWCIKNGGTPHLIADSNKVGNLNTTYFYKTFAGLTGIDHPSIGWSADGSVMYCVYSVVMNDTGVNGWNTRDIFYSYSLDDGVTWSNGIRVTNTPLIDEGYVGVSLINPGNSPSSYELHMVYMKDPGDGPTNFNGGETTAPASRNWLIYRKVTQPTVGITNISTTIPSQYTLEQNYPNPFNPSTTIRFALPQTSNVTLKVYNLNGKEVATLINNTTVQAGTNEYRFDASNLASGIYFYKLTAGKFTDTKKMILIK